MFKGENRIRRVVLLGLAASALLVGAAYPRGGQASPLRATAPSLGTAASFAVLGGSTVTNTGRTIVNGDLGVSPGSAVTGFPPGIVTGSTHRNDAVAGQAQSDTTAAYINLTGQPCNSSLTGQDLGGKTLIAGVYCFSSSAQLTGSLTLNGQGNPSSVFIFQIGSTLTTASASSVLPINGTQSCNVFWQVGSSATLGTTTTFVGSILALTSISLTTGAHVDGRALARNGAVTMDTNHVSAPVCASAPTSTPTLIAAPPTSTATPIPATPTSIAAATATAAAATATAAAATSTAVAATSTAVAATSTAVAATSTAIAATATASAAAATATPTKTPVPTATSTPVPPTATVAPAQTPAPTPKPTKTAPTATTAPTTAPTTPPPVPGKTIPPATPPSTGGGGTYLYSGAIGAPASRVTGSQPAAPAGSNPAGLPRTGGGAGGSDPSSPLGLLAMLAAVAIAAGGLLLRFFKR